MNKDKFWAIIEKSRAEARKVWSRKFKIHIWFIDDGSQLRALEKELEQLSEIELISFGQIYYGLRSETAEEYVNSALRLINFADSDDGLSYLRDWLIAQGRGVFESVMNNPDNLAPFVKCSDYFESFGYVMHDVFKRKFGRELFEALGPVERLKSVSRSAPDDVEIAFPRLAAEAKVERRWFEKVVFGAVEPG